nr:O-antigen ligase family protein [Arcobacter arenosus]
MDTHLPLKYFSFLRFVDLYTILFFPFILSSKNSFKFVFLFFILLLITLIIQFQLNFLFRFFELFIITLGTINIIIYIKYIPYNIIIFSTLVLSIFSIFDIDQIYFNHHFTSVVIVLSIIYLFENRKNYALILFFIFVILFLGIKAVILPLFLYFLIKFRLKKNYIYMLFGIVLSMIVAYAFSNQLQYKINQLKQYGIFSSSSNMQRILMAENTISIIYNESIEKLLFGYGNNYQNMIEDTYSKNEINIGSSASRFRVHNEFLAITLAYGLFGFITYIGILIYFLRCYKFNKTIASYISILYFSSLFNTFFYIGSGLLGWYFFVIAYFYSELKITKLDNKLNKKYYLTKKD